MILNFINLLWGVTFVPFLKNIKEIVEKVLTKYSSVLLPPLEVEFSMELVSQVYQECDGICWKSISEKEFYHTLHNPLDNKGVIQLRYGGKIKAYFVFEKLKRTLPVSLQKDWIRQFLDSADIKQETFEKKRSEVGNNRTKSNRDFARNIKKIFQPFGYSF